MAYRALGSRIGASAAIVFAALTFFLKPEHAIFGAMAAPKTLAARTSAVPPAIPAPIETPAARPAPEPVVEPSGSAAVGTPRKRIRLCRSGSCASGPGSNVACNATFAAAVHSAAQLDAALPANAGSAAIEGPQGVEPLRFQKHPRWVRRLETISKEGIPFVRVPRGPGRELVVGIDRKGVLGISLHQKTEQ